MARLGRSYPFRNTVIGRKPPPTSGNVVAQPGIGSLVVTGLAPSLLVNTISQPGVGSIIVSGLVPTTPIQGKHYYFVDAAIGGANKDKTLQDGGTAPADATTTIGWEADSLAAGQSHVQNGPTEVLRTSPNWGTTLRPALPPDSTKGDAWRTTNVIHGTFEEHTPWTFKFGFRSVTAAYTGRFKIAVRLWAGTDGGGVGARELTSGRVVSDATTADLSTSSDTALTWQWAPGAEVTLLDEYLFVLVGIEITSAGSGTTQDVHFRVGSAYEIITPEFLQTIEAEPGQGTIVVAGLTPTVSRTQHETVAPQTGAIVVSGQAPTASVSVPGTTTALPQQGTVTVTGLAPSIAVSDLVTVAPGIGSIVVTGSDPSISVTGPSLCEPGVGSVVFTGLAPTCIGPAEEVLGGRARPRRKRPYQPKIWVEIRDGQVYAVDDLAEARKVVATVRKQVERKIRQVARSEGPAIELPELPAIRIVGEWAPWTDEASAAAAAANEQLAQFYAQAVLAYAARQDEEDAITALLLT